MTRIATNADVALSHKDMFQRKASRVNGIRIPSSTAQSNPPNAPVLASNLASRINTLVESYAVVLQRSSNQIMDLHHRKEREDERLSRHMFQSEGIFHE